MDYNLEGKQFKSLSNTENGEVSEETIFNYHQEGKHVWADYGGGSIVRGNLIAIKNDNGTLDMYYQHINDQNQIMIGKCISTPSLKDGKLLFREEWQWLNGDCSKGVSVIIEI
ncbi:MAG: n-acetylglutamate synthase [Pseudomonadota bacterium]